MRNGLKSGLAARRNKRRNIGVKQEPDRGDSLPGFLVYWACALRASLTI